MSRILVVDASVVVDLIARFRPEPIEAQIWAPDTHLAAPELIDVEVLHALRRLEREERIPGSRTALVEELRALPLKRFRHASLLAGIWALRGRLTAYDAAYVALTRLLDASLVTRDGRLAKASGLGRQVIVPT